MLRIQCGLHFGVGKSRPVSKSICNGLRSSRPVRQPRLGVCAFKDWFTGLVQQHKEPQSQSQPATQTVTQEQPNSTHFPPLSQLKSAPKRDFLEARQVSLFQLFDSSEYKFDIPTYQRPYAWRTKQIYELLQDFVKAYESRQEYFLGAIVATRAADGANVPYQLIDGQQRLTSLVLLLAFLHGWARQQGNDVLEGRFRRMLYLEADPLESGSNGRYRLRLRDADDEFFRSNVLDAFLPQHYRLAGLAAAAAANGAAGGSGGVEASGGRGVEVAEAGTDVDDDGGAKPLENETWWRLYENAAFLRSQLDKLVSEGLNTQDFAFHVLRNCFVVMMVARDEGASFRIFSTLNGRGMDLSAVDKLKADLLAGELTASERSHFADAWAEMESVLGRAAFHRVFDYMRELAAVRDPCVRETSVLEYFTRRVDDPSAVKQVLQVALDYARLLLQLRQASWAPPELAAMLAETPMERQSASSSPSLQRREDDGLEAAAAAAVDSALHSGGDVVQAAAPVLTAEDEGRLFQHLHEQHRQWRDESGASAAASTTVQALVEVEAEPQAALPLTSKEDESGVLLFRFDEPSASDISPPDASVTATSAAAADVSDSIAVSDALAESTPWATTDTALDVAEAQEVLQLPADVSVSAVAAVEPPPVALLAAVTPVATVEDACEGELPTAPADGIVSPVPPMPIAVEVAGAAAPGELIARTMAATEVAAEAAAGEDAARQLQAALLAELDTRSRHLNLFTDEAWLPPLLEFFYQTDDLELRVAFMKGAEVLQLLLELLGDPAAKAARWGAVSDALLQRPFQPEGVLAALRLTEEEREQFRARLDSKDLYGTADQRTLRHLLVRCEPPSVSCGLSGLSGLLVERVVPQSAPEGSTWRKTRMSSPCDPQSAWPDPWFTATATAGPTATAVPSEEHEPAAAASPSSSYEVKYWYEVQRLNWHGKLGNMVLLPATASSAASATADYEVKAALWRQAGVASRLPGFTGPLVDQHGRYGRFRFCYDECRQRHADMLQYLIAEFEL
ncbi:hypothetical protein Vretimale_11387 [Volvox reticuliferus]|uniref:GmrSD restriction endonucleases N-terminal domain-containing protein n=1 Tax=Volvox reticuliferus TaxID=1737510 RepID=A0A8J4CMI1_9CHLO|nr:hypothetical protein Vretifemale_11913 [Volvox reticuliferus]GIM07304.1 hypothetical protein Vretimale_11387 [Volvox reticuliferus]